MKKVVKFGGSSLASAEQFRKVSEIIHADKGRRYVVPSAPGKRGSKDTKVTDMLYDCYSAAGDAEALTKKIAAIQALIDSRGEDAFPGNLWETVRLRLEYPTDSLSELAQRFDPPISKPGLSHRLKKIIELAEKED